MGLVSIIDGAAIQRAVDRLRNAGAHGSTGTVDDGTREELHANITRGMEFLDEYMPNWRAKVEVDSLNLGEPCRCVLGQVDHDFYTAMLRAGHAEVDADTGVIRADWKWAYEHGFAAVSSLDFEAWDVLTDLWRERIRLRDVLDDVDGQVVGTAGERDLVDA